MESENNVDFEDVVESVVEFLIGENDNFIQLIAIWEEEQTNLIKSQKCTDKLRNTLEEHFLKEQFNVITLQSTDYLEQSTIQLKQLENEEARIMEDISNLEAKFDNLKKADSKKDNAQRKALPKYRDMCKACKELTKISFNYRSARIIGLIMNRNESVLSVNLDPKKMSLDEVTQRLWKYLGLAAGEDWSCISNPK